MSDLSQFLAQLVESYSGPHHLIRWSRWENPESPMHYLEAESHPEPGHNLDLYFFIRQNWVEVMPGQRSLYSDEEADGQIIEMIEGTDWRQKVIAVIESWLAVPKQLEAQS